MSYSTTQTALLNPFPGLRPFRTDESHLFFGREGQIDEVLEKLENNRFIAILGSSGSGKSSFMYCGLIPSLQGGFMVEQGSNWRIITARPGTHPIHNLANALVDKDKYRGLSEKDLLVKKSYYQAIMQSSSLGLVELLAQIRSEGDENILLLIDQFEEIFRFRSKDEANLDESTAFVKMLINAVKIMNKPYYVVLTMRSDFIGDCSIFPELTALINESHYLIPQLNRDQKRSVILGPAAVAGGIISPRLLQQLLNDLNENSDQLPILQHALMRTWDYWQQHRRGDEPIDLFHYEAIGKMESALSLHADEAYVALEAKQQRICEIMFKALTQKGSDGRGVRRPTDIKRIALTAGVSVAEVIEVVECFRQPGRTFLMPAQGELSPETYLDISHESLMRIWNRLAAWVEQESESAKMYLKLCDAALLYQEGKSGLWRPPDLNLATAWKERENPQLTWGIRLNPSFERAMAFLEKSVQVYEEENRNLARKREASIRRNKIIAGVMALVSIAMILLVLYGRTKEQEARSQAKLAKEQSSRADSLLRIANDERARAIQEQQYAEAEKRIAEQERAKAEAEKLKAEEKEREANKAREDAKIQEEKARKEALRAEYEAQKAKEQKELADKSAKEAQDQKTTAEKAKLDADKLRMLALAQSMAAKSQQLKDTNTQLLLAKQAFNFHKKYEAEVLQPDIYLGLYAAVKKINQTNFNEIKGHQDRIASMHFSDNQFYTISADGKVLRRPINTNSYESVYDFDPSELVSIKSVSISQNGGKIAFGCSDGKIRIIDSQSKSLEKVLPASKHLIWALDYDSKQQFIAFSDADSTQITLLDIKTQARKIIAQTNKENKIRSFCWLNDYEIAGVTLKGDVKIWNTKSLSEEVLFTSKNEKGYIMKFSKEAQALAVGYFSGKVLLYKLKQRDYEEFLGHAGWISDISFSPDGKLMATAGYDKRIQVWDLSNTTLPPLVLEDFKTWVTSICFSADSKTLYAGSKDGIIKKFDLNPENLAKQICENIKKQKRPNSLSAKEWNRYVGEEIEKQASCE